MSKSRIEFIKSATDWRDFGHDGRLEIAILGRSNAGKSSLINAMFSTRIARVSQTPGKTRTFNLFNVGEYYRLVDMPGYGFASRSWNEREEWRHNIESYLGECAALCGFVLVMDIRRDWLEDEQNLCDWLRPRQLPWALVLAKADKLNRPQIEKRRRALLQASGLEPERVFVCSSLKRVGVDALEEYMFSRWVKPRAEGEKKW